MPANPEENEPARSPAGDHPRRRALTPEQRRLLGTPRSLPERAPQEEERVAAPQAVEEPEPAAVEIKPPEPRARSADVSTQAKVSRAIELRHAFLVLAALVLLAGMFYAGRKFDRARYVFMSGRNAPTLEAAAQDKFPGLSAGELLETALAAEKAGNWKEAVDRFMAAKRKDLAIPGILFHIGKGSYDRGDVPSADIAFGEAIRFGENLPAANYYRGLIAVQRRDLPAAIRYFEAAANGEPFIAHLYYCWGDALRLDFKPRDSIRRYEQAALRASNAPEATLCRYKIRLARIEAAEVSAVADAVEEARNAGPLSVDWLMTDAALQLQAGKIAEAARLISEARDPGAGTLFQGCAGDILFRRAADAHPEIAALVPGSAAPVNPPATPAPF